MIDDVRAEVRGIRRKLERETVTQRSLDEDLGRANAQLERLPALAPEPQPARSAVSLPPIAWRVGMRARTRTAGAEGRIASLDKGGKRATLEAGGMRITVAVDDLEPATGADAARTVASSLDLRGATVQEALEVLDRYLDDASLAGLEQTTVIHGMGTGALRDAVRDHASAHPLVKSWRPGARGEGGDGATIVSL